MSTPELLPYLLKVNGALLLFCAGYYLLLRRLTFFRLNRAFLLVVLVFAPLYPLLDVSQWFARSQSLPVPLLELAPAWQALPVGAATAPEAINWLGFAYWTGVGVLAVRFLLQLLSLYRLHRRSRSTEFEGVGFRAVPELVAPFAFWQTVYLNPAQHGPDELPAILCHEQVHVREWHTVDVLLAQLSLVFYWFNPGVWLLRQALHENLEFHTDYRVLQSGLLDSKAYQYRLLRQNVQSQAHSNALVSHFNFHLLKTRIAMMNKPRTAPLQAARYLLLLPLAAALTLWGCEKKAYVPEPVSVSQNQTSDATKAMYFLDGVRTTSAALDQLNPTSIASMNVLKGRKFMPGFDEQAFRKDFGDIGEQGIILIVTKAGENSEALRAFNEKYHIVYKEQSPEDKKITMRVSSGNDLSTADLQGRLLLINGKEATPGATKLAAGSVQSVYVLDAEKATAKYGEKGKNGAVVITTKQ
ncbi:Zn-dependent protease with chaperone function [Hymenobacter luteus]|uniref:Zn-dependent protease with chaperone function n=2 Tax=Hymenobacter TaxID=89966 RepID=A0A7W9SYD4_9BACT|nr:MULTISPECIES: M56 family metallopeptidase [Hymenobacter]MBB4599503.1 Zn-dependent protease with chaperone function [Hymenobacter latericoloratus]MBB6058187.1 Zn-dependent protease with chaperone function [Hymenobacter luteus]